MLQFFKTRGIIGTLLIAYLDSFPCYKIIILFRVGINYEGRKAQKHTF